MVGHLPGPYCFGRTPHPYSVRKFSFSWVAEIIIANPSEKRLSRRIISGKDLRVFLLCFQAGNVTCESRAHFHPFHFLEAWPIHAKQLGPQRYERRISLTAEFSLVLWTPKGSREVPK